MTIFPSVQFSHDKSSHTLDDVQSFFLQHSTFIVVVCVTIGVAGLFCVIRKLSYLDSKSLGALFRTQNAFFFDTQGLHMGTQKDFLLDA